MTVRGPGIGILLSGAAAAAIAASAVYSIVEMGRGVAVDSRLGLHFGQASTFLLAGAVLGLQRNHRTSSIACAVAASLFGIAIAANLAGTVTTAANLKLVYLTTPALILLLALGIVGYHTLGKVVARFAAIATAALTSTGICSALAVSIVLGPGGLAASSHSLIHLGVIMALSANCAAFLFIAPIAPPGTTLRWLLAPLGIAGILSSAALLATLALVMPDEPGTLPLLYILGLACSLLIGASLAICFLGAVMLELDSTAEKSRSALQRQRQLMHLRTHVLRQSQKRYKELFRSVQVAVLMTHPSGAIIAANPAMLDMLRIDSEAKLRDVNFRDVFANPDERNDLISTWHASTRDLWKGEVKLRRLDGEEITCLYTAKIIRQADGEVEYHQGVFTDITALRRAETERRALEAHLRLSQKLESVGRLAMGIAHEINTPMQYMGDNLYFLKHAFATLNERIENQRRLVRDHHETSGEQLLQAMKVLDDQAELEHALSDTPVAIERIGNGIDAVNRIVAAIRELAYPNHNAKVQTDLNALIRTALVVARNEYKTIADVTTSFSDLPQIPAHKHELCQVFINLIVNAAHAIETAKRHGGRIGRIRIETSVSEDQALLRFEDNGCGIPQAALDKIFDPFFTTKEVGKGTGQGLAIASRTVDAHGGRIDVDSRPGLGSTFTVRLPLSRENQRPTQDEEVHRCQTNH